MQKSIYGNNRCGGKVHTICTGCRGLVEESGRLLISHETETGYYMFPGGGLENGETLDTCCVREVLEETGYIVKPSERFLELHEFYDGYEFITHYFICKIIGKDTQQLTEEEAVRGLIPEWIERHALLDIFSKYDDYAQLNENKRGAFLREYTALCEYSKIHS